VTDDERRLLSVFRRPSSVFLNYKEQIGVESMEELKSKLAEMNTHIASLLERL